MHISKSARGTSLIGLASLLHRHPHRWNKELAVRKNGSGKIFKV